MRAMRASLLIFLALLLDTPAFGATPTLLDDAAKSRIDRALRSEGIALGDLSSVDRHADDVAPWLKNVLTDPLQGPELGFSLAAVVAMDDAKATRPWTGAMNVPVSVWGLLAEEPDCSSSKSGQSLSSQHIAAAVAQGERWSNRAKRDLGQRLDPTLDALLGGLADEAAVAACGVEKALAGVAVEDRGALVAEAERLLGEVTFDVGESAALQAAWDSVDWNTLLAVGEAWLTAVHAASGKLAGLDAGAWPGSPVIWRIGLGEVWIGSLGANSGAGDPVLLVDPGGDDHWRVRSTKTTASDGLRSVRGWIDLGGDDVWRSGALGAGGAAFGVGAGIDLAGDDVHEATSFSAGAGVFGVGGWLDVAGRDRYDVTVGGQGFGVAGVGILRDARRDDIYRADRWAQGSGLAGGVGLLHDRRGGDRYLLTDDLQEEREVEWGESDALLLPGCHAGCGQGFGAGGVGHGGAGLLIDDDGADLYSSTGWAQGAGWSQGLGVLRDGAGDDRYLGGEHSQGAARARGVGVLIEASGTDEFSLRSGGQGAAEDAGVAWLVDLRGRGRWHAESSAQGWTSGHGAVGIVYSGEQGAFDHHLASPRATRRPSIGVVVGAGDAKRAVRGLLANLGKGASASTAEEVVKRLEAVEPEDARELGLLGVELSDRMQRSPADRAALVPAVLASAQRLKDTDAPRFHLAWIGNLTDRNPMLAGEIEALASDFIAHPDWRVREAAWHARSRLAQFPDLTLAEEEALRIATEAAVALQKESQADVRAAAARVAGVFGGLEVASSLVDALLTEHLGLRRSAENALFAVVERTDGVGVARGLYGVADGDEAVAPVLREAALRVLGATKQREAVEVLGRAVVTGDDRIQLAAAEGLARHGSRAARNALARWLETHPDRVEWASSLTDE